MRRESLWSSSQRDAPGSPRSGRAFAPPRWPKPDHTPSAEPGATHTPFIQRELPAQPFSRRDLAQNSALLPQSSPSLPSRAPPAGSARSGAGAGGMMPEGHARVSPEGEWVFKVNPKSASRRAAPARSLLALSAIDVILPPISRAAAASPLQFPKSLGADRTRSSNTGLELLPEPSPRVGAQRGEGEAAALPSRA